MELSLRVYKNKFCWINCALMVKMYINLKHGKWVGICGELGADTTLTERFVRMGIDELSVSPSMVLGVRSKICEME